MNILVIRETNPFADFTATSSRLLSLVEGLVENGCAIDLLFLNGFYHKSEKERFSKSGSFNHISYKYLLPVNFTNIISRQFFFKIFPDKYLELRIRKHLETKHYDYVWLDFGPKVVKIGLKLIKCGGGTKYFQERSEFSWIGFGGKNKLHDKYLKEFLPQMDLLSIMTGTLISYYKDLIGEKTKMIHLPMTVDFLRFQQNINDNQLEKPYIAYCGSLSNAKDGVDVLIRAFLQIADSFSDLHLYIAGPLNPEQDYLMQRSIIEEAKAEKSITYLGVLNRDEMPSFLSNAKVLALARPESKQAEGGFPTKLGEYLASGKPVCVTSVGEIGNYLRDNESAFIAEPGSVDSFAEALRRALTNKNAEIVAEAGKRVAMDCFNSKIQSKTLHDFLFQNM